MKKLYPVLSPLEGKFYTASSLPWRERVRVRGIK
jgi:hypothetical protein